MIPQIPIFITEEEAKRFIEFQKHYKLIQDLDKIGAWDIKSGSVTLHFNSLGEIKGIEKKEFITI